MYRRCTITQVKRILGIDPGYARLGWGVIDVTDNKDELVAFGCFETPKSEEFSTRLAIIDKELLSILNEHNPTDIVIEELFFGKNTRTAMNVAHARGVIMLRAAHHSGKIYSYRPNQIKTATTENIKAKKPEIQEAVRQILNLESIPKPDDAADALAVAITHARLT
ncbi:MAG: crossover junction endodeoxyribonuclease RuvC [Firmicutes bacterium]|nr:crossover junction endodeoxyribonuclease RuvC [Bacillota bacterium]